MRRLWIAYILINLTAFSSAYAEYRVFRLQIYDSQGQPLRQINSTLDHLQYPAYYPLNPGEAIAYLDSWMCWQRSDHSDTLCADPTPPISPEEENNAETSTDDKTRFPANSAPPANQ